MAKSTVRVGISDTKATDKLLKGLPIEMRQKTLVKAVRAAGNIVAKEARRLCPKPGYTGDKPGKIPLNKTIKVVVRSYDNAIAAFVGPTWPHGAHGHLVEFGHEIKRTSHGPTHTRPKPFMRPAADTTAQAQQRKIIDTLKNEIKKLA